MPSPVKLWSDNDTTVDSVHVQHLVQAVIGVVENPDLTPVTVGVFCPWGSGKSSVVQMVRKSVEREADTDQSVVVVYFNGWRFEGYEDAKAALAAAILEELERRVPLATRTQPSVRDKFVDMWRRVRWLRVAKFAAGAGLAVKTGGLSLALPMGRDLLGVPALSSTDEAEHTGADSQGAGAAVPRLNADDLLAAEAEAERHLHATVRDFDRAFAGLLEASAVTRLVVFVDDLDRCLPDRVIDTLEAIRLFLAVPRTAFVISADEELIQHAVAQRFPARLGYEDTVSRDYLQKMIQIPVRVPPLAPEVVEQYVAMLFAQRNLSASVFETVCEAVRGHMTATWNAEAHAAGAAFAATSAAQFLGEAPSGEMQADLALAAQLAPFLARSGQGNPRLIKRFLNALMLRLEMATARGARLRRDVAAKLLLLEYFHSRVFAFLAQSQATNAGRAPELTELERPSVPASPDTPHAAEPVHPATAPSTGSDEVDEASSHAAAPRGRRTRGAAARATAPASGADAADGVEINRPTALPAWTAVTRSDPWLQEWLQSDPPLADIDLRPYVYFARDQQLLLADGAGRLSAAAQHVVSVLLGGGAANHRAGANLARSMPATDAASAFREIATRVRRSSESHAADGPLFSLIALAETRPELISELVPLLRSIAVTQLEPALPATMLALAHSLGRGGVDVREDVRELLNAWEGGANPSLAAGARAMQARLARVEIGTRPIA